jgi:type II restriction/modification system DNA methylase subunit YeeA
VTKIFADLSGGANDLTTAARLAANGTVCFMGVTPAGPFDVPAEIGRAWLAAPVNPNGRPNSDVIRPYQNAMDITRRSRRAWTIDFGCTMREDEAALYALPFRHVAAQVKPKRMENAREAYRRFWWRYAEPRPAMRAKLADLTRYIATPMVAKHRLFVWFSLAEVAANLLNVIARDDDTTFGILHSRFHEAWSLKLCTWLGVGNDPRYTPSTTFETFPFPEGLTPNLPASNYKTDPNAVKIANAAARLSELREAWLSPSDLVKRVPEVVPGFPDRVLPVDDKAAGILKNRTLTNLYNERPAWLANAHRDLDATVAAAYGWPADISEDDAVVRLFALNQSRATTASEATDTPPTAPVD